MDIYKFSDSIDKSKEYKYKILVYPNITYQKDLEKDSYVVVLCNIIKELNNIRNDLHWTILSPRLIGKWLALSQIFRKSGCSDEHTYSSSTSPT